MGAEHRHGGAEGEKNQKRLAITLGLVGAYMLAEAIGGLVTNSLALLADAGHMLSDMAALALALFAIAVYISTGTRCAAPCARCTTSTSGRLRPGGKRSRATCLPLRSRPTARS
jgi:hypothetical protein